MVEIEKIMPVTMRRYFFLIFFVLIPLVANAVDYDGDFYTEVFYLRDRGNGSAPKTIAGAWNLADVRTRANWATINSDDGKLGPGDCLVVLDNDGDILGTLLTQQPGLPGAPITIRGEVGGSTAVDANGGTFGIAITGEDYITIRNLIFKGGTTGQISVSQADNVTIQGNTFQGSPRSYCIYAYSGDGLDCN